MAEFENPVIPHPKNPQKRSTPRKFNSEFNPENWWLENYISYGGRWLFRGELLNFGGVDFLLIAAWIINMEPKSNPIEKENYPPNLNFLGSKS